MYLVIINKFFRLGSCPHETEISINTQQFDEDTNLGLELSIGNR